MCINAALISGIAMTFVPAHLMKSSAGQYECESLALPYITMVFYFWVRSLRTRSSWVFGIAAGLAYGAMTATAW